jgi:hypothetical protein
LAAWPRFIASQLIVISEETWRKGVATVAAEPDEFDLAAGAHAVERAADGTGEVVASDYQFAARPSVGGYAADQIPERVTECFWVISPVTQSRTIVWGRPAGWVTSL